PARGRSTCGRTSSTRARAVVRVWACGLDPTRTSSSTGCTVSRGGRCTRPRHRYSPTPSCTNSSCRPTRMLALETRLIFVEGLPGAGKTTTSTYIAERLRRKRLAVETWAEVEPDHPLNVGGALHPAGSTTGAGLFAS